MQQLLTFVIHNTIAVCFCRRPWITNPIVSSKSTRALVGHTHTVHLLVHIIVSKGQLFATHVFLRHKNGGKCTMSVVKSVVILCLVLQIWQHKPHMYFTEFIYGGQEPSFISGFIIEIYQFKHVVKNGHGGSWFYTASN